ncbi:hypothetical protein B005_3915 [Nocardiopsis alba ATCC BAA-2165]|uniref:Uncharacterized protein n=1 Tax=Nocardiopsis alba (strain ATCC BAA-2165 / BE74) TaxID=1205910 RepID=J7LHQ7_NOCAA|nr:hypothetical protein B005_3915 [Nocardiopsis alba ATCC BAA-2165]
MSGALLCHVAQSRPRGSSRRVFVLVCRAAGRSPGPTATDTWCTPQRAAASRWVM